MSRNSVYVRVLLVVMVIALLVSFLGRSNRATPHDAWLPSSFNPVGAGNLAFYQTLDDLHWPVERWREPFSRLPIHDSGDTLVIARSAVDWRVAFTKEEDELLDGWVKAGNTLLLLGPMAKWDDSRALLAQVGINAPSPAEATSIFESFQVESPKQVVATPGPGESGRLVLPRNATLSSITPSGSTTLWSSGGAPVVLEVPHGKGRVVCISSEQILGPHYLPQGDNLAIVLGLLAPNGLVPAHLFFEERHHGFSPSFAMARLVGHPSVRLAALLALLGALTFLGSTFVRFGPVLPLERAVGRSSLEFIDSIAELYHRADLRNEMMRFLFDDTYQHLLHRLHLPDTAPHEVIASRLKQAHPELPGWKKLAQRFDSQDYIEGLPPTGWLRVARELIQIKTAVV